MDNDSGLPEDDYIATYDVGASAVQRRSMVGLDSSRAGEYSLLGVDIVTSTLDPK